jgi:hypothetical protein
MNWSLVVILAAVMLLYAVAFVVGFISGFATGASFSWFRRYKARKAGEAVAR